MSDPWLTDDGKLHSAAEPLSEWEAEGLMYRLRFLSELACWRIEYCDPGTKTWYLNREITAHEAAALLEKHLRGWLAKRDIGPRQQEGGWVVCYWPLDTYLREDGTWGNQAKAQLFPTYTAALQVACAAVAKGDDDDP